MVIFGCVKFFQKCPFLLLFLCLNDLLVFDNSPSSWAKKSNVWMITIRKAPPVLGPKSFKRTHLSRVLRSAIMHFKSFYLRILFVWQCCCCQNSLVLMSIKDIYRVINGNASDNLRLPIFLTVYVRDVYNKQNFCLRKRKNPNSNTALTACWYSLK